VNKQSEKEAGQIDSGDTIEKDPEPFKMWEPEDDDEDALIAAAMEEEEIAASEKRKKQSRQDNELSEGVAAALAKLRNA
jgi:DNA excision repair protein ERCC-1